MVKSEEKKKNSDLIPAVIYARYSSSGQREESIEGQIRECTEYAERNGMRVLRSYSDKATGMFKGFIQNVEASNPNYKWEWKEQSLVARLIGIVLGEEEYRKQDGSIGTRFGAKDKTVAAIRDGKFKVPEKKVLKEEAPAAPVWSAVEDSSDELPF